MLSTVSGVAKGATDRMIDKNGARRADVGHDVENRADNEGWNSMALDDMGDETDGLVAERSVGNEERQIDLGFGQFAGDRRRKLALNLRMLPQPAHKRKVARR